MDPLNVSLSDTTEVLEHLLGHQFSEPALLAACVAVCSRLLPRYHRVHTRSDMERLRAVAELAATKTITLQPLEDNELSKFAGASVVNGDIFVSGD